MAEHHAKPMAELSAILLDAVQAFAQGAPQEDDMTIVLVKREARRGEQRMFRAHLRLAAGDLRVHRGISSPGTASIPESCATVDLAVEELFTNMVKYSPGGAAEVTIDIAALAGGVEVVLTDYDVERFDVTRAPDADIDLPIEQRKPGGLGLHLIRRMVDSIEYEYSQENAAKPDHVPQDAGGTARDPAERREHRGRGCWRLISVRGAWS